MRYINPHFTYLFMTILVLTIEQLFCVPSNVAAMLHHYGMAVGRGFWVCFLLTLKLYNNINN